MKNILLLLLIFFSGFVYALPFDYDPACDKVLSDFTSDENLSDSDKLSKYRNKCLWHTDNYREHAFVYFSGNLHKDDDPSDETYVVFDKTGREIKSGIKDDFNFDNYFGDCNFFKEDQHVCFLHTKNDKYCENGIVSFDSSLNAFVCGASCTSLSDYTVDITKDQCSGSNFKYYDIGKIGSLSYQVCDNTCYLLEVQNMTCADYTDDIVSSYSRSCDTDLNKFIFNCYEENGEVRIEHSCTPLNEKSTIGPCSDLILDNENNCSAQGMVSDGECHDNGIIVEKNTLTCKVALKECLSVFGEVYNSDTKLCDCMDGYYRDDFGNCTYSLIVDNNSTDLNETLNKKQHILEVENGLNKNINGFYNDFNNSFNGINSKLLDISISNNGIRDDLSLTNELLNDIRDELPLNNDDNELEYDNPNIKSENYIMDVFSDVQSTVDKISSDFSNLSSKIENGFSISPTNVGKAPVFETSVFGTHTLKISLCDTFSRFYSIFFYIFVMGFTFFSIRIFIFSFMLRG